MKLPSLKLNRDEVGLLKNIEKKSVLSNSSREGLSQLADILGGGNLTTNEGSTIAYTPPGIPTSTKVKLPFIQKQISLPSADILAQTAKWAVETPEKVWRSLKQVPYNIRTGKLAPIDENKLRVPSIQEEAVKTKEHLLNAGYGEPTADTVAILNAIGDTIFSTVFTGDAVKGVANILEKGALDTSDKVAAWELLGKPRTMRELKQNYEQLAYQLHPDIAGEGSEKAFSKVSQAYNLLDREKLPTKLDFAKFRAGATARRLTKEPVSELGKPVAGVEPGEGLPLAQLPGYAQKEGVPVGLSTKELKPVETKIPKELEPLAKEARKYKSAADFVREINKKDFGRLVIQKTKLRFEKVNPSNVIQDNIKLPFGYKGFAVKSGNLINVYDKKTGQLLGKSGTLLSDIKTATKKAIIDAKNNMERHGQERITNFLDRQLKAPTDGNYIYYNKISDENLKSLYNQATKQPAEKGVKPETIKPAPENRAIIKYPGLRLPGGEPVLGGRKTTKATAIKRLEAEKKQLQREALGFVLRGKPKITFRLTPAEKLKLMGREPATSEQIKQAHILAKEKAYLSEKGKVKPQYRRLALGITGKKSIRQMTKQEASAFINALRRLPKPIVRNGKVIPPSIPKTTKIVPTAFFGRKFKEPTLSRLLTSQTYYAEILGVKPLTEPLELAKQNFDLQYRNLANAVDKQIKTINKIGKTGLREKTVAKIKNKPTRAVQEMRDLLDKYEEPPTWLSPEKKAVFNWFRNLNRTILKGENEVRAKLDLEPIKYRKAYVRHTAEAMAKEMLMGKYPFPEGLKYWSQRMVGKKIFNPMEFQRQLADDLENYFTKDLAFATKSMLWTGLKEIHLSQPLRAFSEQLGALSKDLPVYEGLSPEELRQVRAVSVMPASTKKWLVDYVNQVIKGQQTFLDEEVNRIVVNSGLGGLLNKALKPFGRTIGQKPITGFFQKTGRAIISGVMGWRPKQLIRNKFQLIQNLALYSTKSNLKGFLPANKQIKELLNESTFLKGYTGFEELPTNIQQRLEKLWLAPYQWTAVSNVKQTMKVAYWDTLELITKPKYRKYGWADPARTYKEPKGFLYPSEKERLLKEMEFGAGATQYSYIPMGMPELFRHKALIPITRLQSWWMNYFAKFTREAIHRAIKGETMYGARLPWSRRLGYLRYLVLGGSILTAMGYKKSFLLGVAPTYLSPAAQITLGFYNYVTASSDWQKTMAKKRIYQSWRAFIPGSLAWKDYSDVWAGKKPLESLFLYTKPKKKIKINRKSPLNLSGSMKMPSLKMGNDLKIFIGQ